MNRGTTVCLVSPSHLSNNPRLVKEADALHAAGYGVHVVCGRYFPLIDQHDHAIARSAPWPITVVDYTKRVGTLVAEAHHRWARRRLARGATHDLSLAARAQHRAASALAAAAQAIPADLYIGHLTAGFAAAATAARAHGAPYGFDAEDFHPAETDAALDDPGLRHAMQSLEQALLPACRHFTAASPLIAEAYAETYGVELPVTVLNVFPLAHSPAAPMPAPGTPPKLYWFSQTVGPNRGLEQLVAALGRAKTVCDLELRGLPAAGFADHLSTCARESGMRGRLTFQPLADAADMVRLAQTATLGLSLEQSTPRNRDLCLTNKIFTYLLAGVPVALTPTSAQRAIARDLGAAALEIDLTAPESAASALDAFLADTERLMRARDAAWQLGRTRFNWDVEQQAFLKSVSAALHSHASTRT